MRMLSSAKRYNWDNLLVIRFWCWNTKVSKWKLKQNAASYYSSPHQAKVKKFKFLCHHRPKKILKKCIRSIFSIFQLERSKSSVHFQCCYFEDDERNGSRSILFANGAKFLYENPICIVTLHTQTNIRSKSCESVKRTNELNIFLHKPSTSSCFNMSFRLTDRWSLLNKSNLSVFSLLLYAIFEKIHRINFIFSWKLIGALWENAGEIRDALYSEVDTIFIY